MKFFSKGIKNRFTFVAISLVVLILVIFLQQGGLLSRFEFKIKDSFGIPKSPPTQVSVVHVDPASEQILGQLLWNGELLSQVVMKLDAAGVRVIVLDLPLSWEGDYEDQLEEAIRDSSAAIVLASEIDNSGIQVPQDRFTQYSGVLSGFRNLEKDNDSRIRRSAFHGEANGQKVFSLGLRALQSYYGIDDGDIFELPIELGSHSIKNPEHLMTFYGPSQTINSVTLSGLLGDADLSEFENDVVVVGISTPDEAVLTSEGYMDLNEVQATIIANEINNHGIVPSTNEASLSTLGTVWLVFVIVHLLFSFRISTLLTAVFVGGYTAIAVSSFRNGFSIEVLSVVGTALVLWLIGFVAALSRWMTRAQPLKREFVGVISRKLMEKEMGKLNENVSGERKEVTYLSGRLLDLASSTREVQPAEFLNFIRHFHARVLAKIFHHAGSQIQNKAGEFAAVWNAPITDKHHAINAALTSLEIKDVLGEFNQQHARSDIPPLKCGIGISTGEAIVGNLGEVEDFQYGVVGDPKEIAQKLSQLAPQYGASVLIDRSVVQNLVDAKHDHPQFHVRWVDRVRFKGWDDSIDVFQLITREKVDTNTPDLIKMYESALSDYIQGDFEAALATFTKIVSEYSDPAAVIMTKRTQTLSNIQVNWQGYWIIE